MKNATHETLGATAALAVCAVAGVDALTTCAAVAASLLGSRLPDADQAGSKIHRRTRLERRSVALGVVGFVLRLPLRLFAAIVDHRGATHWLSSAVAITAACGALAAAINAALILPVAVGIAGGYVMHLLADACTPHGAPLLGPVRRQRVHLLPARWRIPTGSHRELGVWLAGLCAAAVLVLTGPLPG